MAVPLTEFTKEEQRSVDQFLRSEDAKSGEMNDKPDYRIAITV